MTSPAAAPRAAPATSGSTVERRTEGDPGDLGESIRRRPIWFEEERNIQGISSPDRREAGVDIGAWLGGLGLGQYEAAFRDNDIDFGLLPSLTADDLRDLGVVSVGHRRRILDAVPKLSVAAECTPESPSTAPDTIEQPASGHAERRQLTVMFVDLVDSTALANRLDPEETRGVLRLYQDACAGAVGRFEGHVAKFMGDGVIVYFGCPCAHEDDAERAVRAGLEVVRAVGALALSADLRLQVRVGIATGVVVVGDLIGEGAAREEAVTGETPNLSARLQGLAGPGDVILSQITRQLVGGRFMCADLGPHLLKGFAEPVRAWRVIEARQHGDRFEARQTGRVTPLVGRDHELGLLLDRWQRAKEGEGQVVLLCGEPGLGKSRLVQALREALVGEPFCTVVLSLALDVLCAESELPGRGTIGAQAVGHQFLRRHALLLEQPAQQPQGRVLVATALHEHIEDLAFAVDGPPQVHRPTGDFNEHFVQMPPAARSTATAPQSLGAACDPDAHSANSSSTSRRLRVKRR
jgi:class 3 adenylate cyclase